MELAPVLVAVFVALVSCATGLIPPGYQGSIVNKLIPEAIFYASAGSAVWTLIVWRLLVKFEIPTATHTALAIGLLVLVVPALAITAPAPWGMLVSLGEGVTSLGIMLPGFGGILPVVLATTFLMEADQHRGRLA